MVEIKRPGSASWESGQQLGGSVPLANVVGSLIRYPSGIVLRVAGLTEPSETGTRQLLLELHDGSSNHDE